MNQTDEFPENDTTTLLCHLYQYTSNAESRKKTSVPVYWVKYSVKAKEGWGN
jgi:predicted ribosome quality control (RQC) complex YloA/Tae2 family protein